MVVNLAGGRKAELQELQVSCLEFSHELWQRHLLCLYCFPSSCDQNGNQGPLPARATPGHTQGCARKDTSQVHLHSVPFSHHIPSDFECNQIIKIKPKFIYHHRRIAVIFFYQFPDPEIAF